jgi:hypothetical protein
VLAIVEARRDAFLAHGTDADVVKERSAVGPFEFLQLTHVVELVSRRSDPDHSSVLHGHQRHNHIVEEGGLQMGSFFEDDQIGRASSQT